MKKLRNKSARISSYVIVFLIPLLFLFCNAQYSGPAYLADEIGYLTKAALIAGYVVDGASIYHSGYALILAPVFMLFNTSEAIWSGTMIVNALLWFGSLFLLSKLLTIWYPDISGSRRFFTLLVSATYPAWLTMSGYTFSTSAFIFVYLWSVITLAAWRQTNVRSIVPHSLLVGYLYWIHPSAIGVMLASFIVVLVVGHVTRNYRAIVTHTTLVVLLIFLYEVELHPWMNAAMTPDGYSANKHYPNIISVSKHIANFPLWPDLAARILGQISYVTISSFGLVFFAVIDCMNRGRTLLTSRNEHTCRIVPAMSLFLALSLFFVLGVGAVGLVRVGPVPTDDWICGRYVDGVVLPLLAVGFLALGRVNIHVRLVAILVAIATVVSAGYLIELLRTPGAYNNIINTPAFWPQFVVPAVNFTRWMLVGSFGLLLVVIFGKYVAVTFMIVSFVFSSAAEIQWHKNILSMHSKPSSIVEFVRVNYPPKTCIGFDPEFPMETNLTQRERFGLYNYYFFDYHYRRMSKEVWLKGCEGPLFTYNPEQFVGSATEHIVARENTTGLFLVVKQGKALIDIPQRIRSCGDVSYASDRIDSCLLAGCFAVKADELPRFSEVGVIRRGGLSSNGKSGYLFFGPYRSLNRGSYLLRVHGRFRATDAAVIDVVSNQGKKTYYEGKLSKQRCVSGEVVIPFELKERVTDLEIRLHVGKEDLVSITDYEIVLNP